MLEVLLFLCQYELFSWIFRIWIFIPWLRRFTLKLCQTITPHQKFSFYHLPTRGRAGIKLGDAWYVSNVSIIFDCSMLLYLLFCTILGFIFHFYIIFRTNLLTGGPAQNWCFLPISVFHRNRISNGVQTEWNLRKRDLLTERDPGDLDPTPRSARGGHEGGGRALPLGAPPALWALWRSTDVLLPPIYTYVSPNDQNRSQKPNSTAATFCIHEIPSWGLFRSSAGGGIHHGGLLHHHHSPSDEVWVVYFRPSGP